MKTATFSFSDKFDSRFLTFSFLPDLIKIQFMAKAKTVGNDFRLYAKPTQQGHYEYPYNNLANIPTIKNGEERILEINDTQYTGRLFMNEEKHESGLSVITLSLYGDELPLPSDYYIDGPQEGTLHSAVGPLRDRTKYPQGCFEIVKAGVLNKCSGFVRQDHEAFLQLLETQFEDARSTKERIKIFKAYWEFFNTRSKFYMHYATLRKILKAYNKKVRQILAVKK